jgi:subtilisin-like proprotein convertase family protein
LLGAAAASGALVAGVLTLPKAQPAGAQQFEAATRKTYSFNTPIQFVDMRPSIPYDTASIRVTGLLGTIESLRITLHGLTHNDLGDMNILLRAPNGRFLMLLSDAGVGTEVTGTDLVFSDSAVNLVPASGPIQPGTYLATNHDPTPTSDAMPFPAQPPNITTVSQLTGLSAGQAHGDWFLYTYDRFNGNGGSLRSWSLEFVTSNRAPSVRNSSYSVEQGATLKVNRKNGVLRRAKDPDNDRITIVSPLRDKHRLGRLRMKRNGSFTFVAVPNRTGVARFRFEATDGEAIARGKLAIRVTPLTNRNRDKDRDRNRNRNR